MDIIYEIKIHNHWHCGSGLAAGADVDALAVKDKFGMPYIPGKTIKGLIREAVDEIIVLTNNLDKLQDDYIKTFGYFEDDEKSVGIKEMFKGASFFSNAELREGEYAYILNNDLVKYMYDSVSHTAIGENGIAKKHSLRRVEVVVPCVLQGKILNVPDDMEEVLKQGMKFIKCLGLGRNRGLGRCTISIVEGGNK